MCKISVFRSVRRKPEIIKSNFECVSKTITYLKTSEIEMSEAFGLINELTRKLEEEESTPFTENIQNKIKSVLYLKMKDVQ